MAKDTMCIDVSQCYIVANRIGVKGFFVHLVVDKRYDINVFKLEVPILTFFSLFANGKGGIIERAIFKVFLSCILHLDNKLFAFFVFAVNVENSFSFSINVAYVFTISKLNVFYHLLSFKQRVQKANEQVFIRL